MEKQLQCACMFLSPKLAPLGTKREVLAQQNSPRWEKEREVSEPLPSLSRHCTKDSLGFLFTETPAELRHLEMAKNKEAGQGRAVAATQWEYGSQCPALQGTPAACATTELNSPCRFCRPSQTSPLRFSTHSFWHSQALAT